MKTIYLIKKVYVSDGLIETEVELYSTKQLRDDAFESLVHNHNNMIQDAYEIRLSDYKSWEKKFYYEWNHDTLEFYDRVEPDCHHDIFEKGEEVLYE